MQFLPLEKQQEKQQEQDEHWAELPHPMTTRSGKKIPA